MVSLLLSVVLSASPPGFRLEQTFVDRVDVLAVSIESGYAAFRVVMHQESMLEDVVDFDCKYPGLLQYPASGDTLVLWSLTKQRVVSSFVIHSMSHSAKGCTSPKEVERRLKAANAALAKSKLDTSAPPVEGFGPIVVTEKKEIGEDDNGEFERMTYVFTVGKLTLHTSTAVAYMGSCEIKTKAYVQNGRVVFFEYTSINEMRSELANFAFTRVMTLPPEVK